MYGSDRVLLEDVRGLLQAGWNVTVALPAEGLLAEALRPLGAEVIICPTPVLRKSIFKPHGAATFFKEAVRGIRHTQRLLSRIKPAAVLVNTTTIPLWLALPRLSGHRIVLHVHESERRAPTMLRVGLSLPSALAHRVITNSHFTNDSYLQFVPWVRSRSQVILNGVPGPEDTTPPRAQLDRPVRLLYVGRLSERKGVMVAVEAVEMLQRKGVDVELSLVGAVYEGYEWFEQKLREKVAGLPRPERVKFLGFQDPVWPHYATADIALVPSTLEEPFGNTAVEAVLAERPVIASRIGGLREAAEPYDSAVLVAPGDAGDLARGIERIIENWQDYRRDASAAVEIARRRHDPRHFGAQVEEVVSAAATR